MFSKLYSKLRFLQVSVQKRLFNKEACHWRSWSELSFKHRTSRSFVSFICRQTPGLLSLLCALLLPFQKQHYRKYNHHTTTFFTEINSVEPEKSKVMIVNILFSCTQCVILLDFVESVHFSWSLSFVQFYNILNLSSRSFAISWSIFLEVPLVMNTLKCLCKFFRYSSNILL